MDAHYFPFELKSELNKIDLKTYFLSCVRKNENNKGITYFGSFRGRPLSGCVVKPVPSYSGMIISPENLSRQNVTKYQVNEIFPQYTHWNLGLDINEKEHKFFEEWIEISTILNSE